MKNIGYLIASLLVLNCLGQLTPPEMYLVNLSALNLSASAISSANVSIYTGYTALNAGTTGTPPKRQIGYIYVQASGNNSNVAIVPIGGIGPGYSSLEMLFNEIGPFIFTEDIQTQSELQYPPYGLGLNVNALSQQSNLLFIDAIPLVGISYWSTATIGQPTNNNDAQQVSDIYSVLQDVVQATGFTYLKNYTFHIIGSGYAAKLAPLLAQTILNDQTLALKLGGLFIGNPRFQSYPLTTTSFTSFNQEDQNVVNFLNGHNIIGDAEYQALQQCIANMQDPLCLWGTQTLQTQAQNLNFLDLFRYCYSDGLAPLMYSCIYNMGLNYFLTNANIQTTLYFMKTPTYTNFFNLNIRTNYNYDYTNNSLVVLQNLINQNKIKIWFYSGDASAILSQTDSTYYLAQVLNLQIATPSQKFSVTIPNPTGNQVGGFYTGFPSFQCKNMFQGYNNGVVFATLKKAGFLAGKWKGLELQTLFSMYLQAASPSN